MEGRPQAWKGLATDNKEHGDYYRAITGKIFIVEATENSTGKNERSLLLGHVKNVETGVPEILSNFYEHDVFVWSFVY